MGRTFASMASPSPHDHFAMKSISDPRAQVAYVTNRINFICDRLSPSHGSNQPSPDELLRQRYVATRTSRSSRPCQSLELRKLTNHLGQIDINLTIACSRQATRSPTTSGARARWSKSSTSSRWSVRGLTREGCRRETASTSNSRMF